MVDEKEHRELLKKLVKNGEKLVEELHKEEYHEYRFIALETEPTSKVRKGSGYIIDFKHKLIHRFRNKEGQYSVKHLLGFVEPETGESNQAIIDLLTPPPKPFYYLDKKSYEKLLKRLKPYPKKRYIIFEVRKDLHSRHPSSPIVKIYPISDEVAHDTITKDQWAVVAPRPPGYIEEMHRRAAEMAAKGEEAPPEKKEEKPPEAEEVAEDIKEILEKVTYRLKKLKRTEEVLEDDKAFETRTVLGIKLRSIKKISDWLGKIELWQFIEHLMAEGGERGDIVHWISVSLRDEELAKRLRTLKEDLKKLKRWEEGWEKTGGNPKEFVKLDWAKNLSEKIKAKVIEALERRKGDIEKAREDELKGIEEQEEKIERKVKDVGVEAQEIIEKLKKIEGIEKEVDARINDLDKLINWILKDAMPTIISEGDPEERAKGWSQIKEVINTLIGHRKIIEESISKAELEIPSAEAAGNKLGKNLGNVKKEAEKS